MKIRTIRVHSHEDPYSYELVGSFQCAEDLLSEKTVNTVIEAIAADAIYRNLKIDIDQHEVDYISKKEREELAAKEVEENEDADGS